jgi:uncharacterized protein (DUF2225 family)
MLEDKDIYTIVLCPQCAVKAFRRELEEKIKIKYNLLTSGKPLLQTGARILIITQTSLKKYIDYIDKISQAGKKLLLMIDEAQILHDSNNQFYQLIGSRRQLFDTVWLMTATPLGNDLEGLYWMLYFLNPRIVGPMEEFKAKYFVIHTHQATRWVGKYPHKYRQTYWQEDVVGYKNLDKLSEELKDYVILRQKQYNLVWNYHKFNINEKETEQYFIAGQGLKRETSEKNFAVRIHDLQMIVDNITIPIDKQALEYKITQKLKQANKFSQSNLKALLKSNLDMYSKKAKDTTMSNPLSSKEREFLKVIQTEIKNGRAPLVYLDYQEGVDRLEMLLNKTKSITHVKQILKVTGSISLKDREVVEESIKPGTVVIITSAGTESINLQKSNSFIFYDIPFSVLTFIQAVGRITRVDSTYSQQYIHIIEATGTIDTYKRILINMNANLIETIFGGIETLPMDMLKIDKRVQSMLKSELLWCFKSDGKLISDDELEIKLKELMKGNEE